MRHKRLIILTTALALSLCGCVNISDRTLPVPLTEETTAGEPVENTATEITTAAAETTLSHDVTLGETYGVYEFSDSDDLFLSDCVFVGDSVCKGLSHYGLIPVSQNYALGGIAARNLFEFKFDVGGDSVEPLIAIANANKNNIVLWMGMNDLNMTDSAEYAENYKNILMKIQAVCPLAEIYALAITPLSEDSDFSSNDVIDRFNASLSDMIGASGYSNWHYVDVKSELVNADGYLKYYYNAGDGLHMAQVAYYGVLWKLCGARVSSYGG